MIRTIRREIISFLKKTDPAGSGTPIAYLLVSEDVSLIGCGPHDGGHIHIGEPEHCSLRHERIEKIA
jgi:hypothetical protein